MGNFKDIQLKLQGFVKKYYTNELIKGLILFTALGFLYFLITLFIEYFLWLKPSIRTILFFVFVLVELSLLIKFILVPLSKLTGIKKGITLEEASQIIGKHFKEVDDKLLNVLQLSENKTQTELLLASIEQKAASMQLVPFKNAISFKKNIKHLKYLTIPLVIWGFTILSGNDAILNESLTRVVNYKTAYAPPAPFIFKIMNDNLRAIEGRPYELQVETVGKMNPENVQIVFNNEIYLLKDNEQGLFSYTFSDPKEALKFNLQANGLSSVEYLLEVIKTPTVTGFKMNLDYPSYTGKRDEVLNNTGNAVIPEGSRITWKIITKATDSLKFKSTGAVTYMTKTKDEFVLSKRISNNLNYEVSTSNRDLNDFEKLAYAIRVIKDEFPLIEVKSDIDSVSRGPIQFAGQLSDDYGLSKLVLVFYNTEDKKALVKKELSIKKGPFEEFYYVFSPADQPGLEEGKTYEIFFQVFDNDGVNGSKSTKSSTFTYYYKTKQELTDDLLKEQYQSLEELSKTAKKTDKLSKDFEEFSKKLKNKAELNWNDKKEIDAFIKRQERYQDMLEQHTDRLKENLNEQEQNNDDKSLSEKKDELMKRIEEAQELQEKNDLLKQLKEMAEKLDKEQMLEKLDKLGEQNKQKKRTIERLLEMSKRFFVEKKMVQIGRKLDSLSKKQDQQSQKEHNEAKDQEKLNKEFKEIEKDFEELNKQNRQLAQPMTIPDTGSDQDVIEETMKQAKENLDNSQTGKEEKGDAPKESQSQQKARNQQKAAAHKMKEMSKKMQGAVQAMQGEMIDANIETLRAILENLLSFSFDQEQLMLSFENVDASKADFPIKLKKQQILKENFEHIDDSLYTLSLRVQQLSSNIQKHLTEAHYNLDKSLENIAENRIQRGQSNQQFTMTSANNLADMLSDVLNSLQNPSSGGKGKGQGESFSLPDIIKKQGELGEKMQYGIEKGEKGKDGKEGEGKEGEGKDGKKGKKEGQGQGGGEGMTGEQYEIYQQQNALREALKELLDKEGGNNGQGQKMLDQMEALEKQLLDKGFKNEVLENMQRIEHELLKLDKARIEQGKDNKRNSETNTIEYPYKKLPIIKGDKLYFNTNEILNREPLPLRSTYKNKVREYFKAKTDK